MLLLACKREVPPEVTGFSFVEVAKLTARADPIEDGAVDLAFTADAYFVLYRDGTIEQRSLDHTVIAERKIEVRRNNDCGGLALEVDPRFAENRRVYAGYCAPGDTVELRSFEWNDGPLVPILSWDRGPNDFHNLGDLGWDGDHLWITYGDGNRSQTSQEPGDLRGKLLRITPRDGPGYDIPADNPFGTEVVALGIKSAFRAWFDGGTWFLGECSLRAFEEVNLATLAGANFGYPLCEGVFALSSLAVTSSTCTLPDHVPPALSYPHDVAHAVIRDDPLADTSTRTGFCITGGPLVRGGQYFGALDGWYLYSDNQRHFVRRARFVDGTLVDDRHLGHLPRVWSWAIAPDGFVYALTPEAIFRLEAQSRSNAAL
jgi:glucose/arabinose dehydrogenase